MHYRTVKIFTGREFQVPQGIQRLDSPKNRGWQLRYGSEPTQYFADGTADGSGAEAALRRALSALHRRIRALPATTGLHTTRAQRKTTKLPVGISGPYERSREGKVPYYTYQVCLPVPGGGSTTRHVYIGTENTANAQRRKAALAHAVQLRQAAVEAFAVHRTKEVRAAARKARNDRAA